MINVCIKSLMMMLEGAPIHEVLNCLLKDITHVSGSMSGLLGKKHIRTSGELVYRYYGIVGFDSESQIYKKFEHDGFIDNNVHLMHVKKDHDVMINNNLNLNKDLIPVGHPNISKAVFITNDDMLLILGGNEDYDISRHDDYELYSKITNIFLRLCLERESYLNDRVLFLVKISQELRSPIMGIIQSSKKINENPKITKKYVEILNSCCMQLLDVVNDIIDYTRILNNDMQFVSEPIKLNKLLNYVNDFTIPKIPNGVDFHIEHPKHVPKVVFADKIRLTQLFLNVLDNCCKFTDSGKIHLKCSVTEETKENATISCEVCDTGSGISDTMLSEIFSIKNTKTGLGVGLIIARHIVQRYGGTLTIKRSSEPTGTIVSFDLHLSKINSLDGGKSMNYVLMETSGNTDVDAKLYDALNDTNYRVIVALDQDQLLSIVEKKSHEIKKIVVFNNRCIPLIRRYMHEHILHITSEVQAISYPNVSVIPLDFDGDDIISILEEKPQKPKALVATNNMHEFEIINSELKDTYKIHHVKDGLELFTSLANVYTIVIIDYQLTLLNSVVAVQKSKTKNTNIYFFNNVITDKFKQEIYQEGVNAKGFLRTPIGADDINILKQNLRM